MKDLLFLLHVFFFMWIAMDGVLASQGEYNIIPFYLLGFCNVIYTF